MAASLFFITEKTMTVTVKYEKRLAYQWNSFLLCVCLFYRDSDYG